MPCPGSTTEREGAPAGSGDPHLPHSLCVETAAGRDDLLRIAPGLHGHIYASRSRPFCYRVLPPDEAKLWLRAALDGWREQPRRPGLAPVADARWTSLDGYGQAYVVCYEAARVTTLAEALADGDVRVRLARLAETAAALRGWWRSLGHAVGLAPADVVFDLSGGAYLLALPAPRPPDVSALFTSPSRAWLLPPEVVRGREPVLSQASDRYALGACLLRCAYTAPLDTDGEEVLWRQAAGVPAAGTEPSPAVPFWVERRQGVRPVVDDALERLMARNPAARQREDLDALAARLRECVRRMDPRVAVDELRRAGRRAEAAELLKDVLLHEDDPGLLVLAGDLARETPGTLLDALDSYERAIQRDPGATAAYLGQLEAVAALLEADAPGAWLAGMGGRDAAGARLDGMVERDFARVPPDARRRFEEPLARYWLGRGRWDPAARFIYACIHEGGAWQWWKLDLNVAYAQALAGQGRWDAAEAHLAALKARIPQVRRSGAVAPAVIHACGVRLAEVERQVHLRVAALPVEPVS